MPAGSTNCILYHYDGFLNVILLAAAYMAMIFHMIARLAVERRRYSESTALEDSGNSSSESIVENKPTLPQHRWSFFENWLIRWKDSARPQTALKVYLLLIAVLLLIPILLHIIDDKYHDLTSQCDERTTIEIAGLILLFILILGSFCYGLIKIRSFQTPYGEKQRLVGLIVAWVLILIILPAVGFVDSPWVKVGNLDSPSSPPPTSNPLLRTDRVQDPFRDDIHRALPAGKCWSHCQADQKEGYPVTDRDERSIQGDFRRCFERRSKEEDQL